MSSGGECGPGKSGIKGCKPVDGSYRNYPRLYQKLQLNLHRPLRLLYLHPDTMGLDPVPAKNPLFFLSKYFAGDYLAIWWVDSDEEARERVKGMREALGRFDFHWTRSYRYPPLIRELWDLGFFVGKGLSLAVKHGRYDAIVTYGPYRTGLAGYILRLLTGSPLILEIPGNPRRSMNFGTGRLAKLKARAAPALASFLVRRADHLWLRYPTQISDLTPIDERRISVHPNFVPVSQIPSSESSEQYVFFLGFPWHLKGVDILIRAFNRISAEFPEAKLKLMGHCPDRAEYEELRAGNPNIIFLDARPHDEAMQFLAKCSLFVLPSRTDAMARVLLEAMAARKPIIASRIDGTPFYLRHKETALLFESEDVGELAASMKALLGNPAYARRLGEAGHRYVHRELSEERFAEHFRRMIESVITGDRARRLREQ